MEIPPAAFPLIAAALSGGLIAEILRQISAGRQRGVEERRDGRHDLEDLNERLQKTNDSLQERLDRVARERDEARGEVLKERERLLRVQSDLSQANLTIQLIRQRADIPSTALLLPHETQIGVIDDRPTEPTAPEQGQLE